MDARRGIAVLIGVGLSILAPSAEAVTTAPTTTALTTTPPTIDARRRRYRRPSLRFPPWGPSVDPTSPRTRLRWWRGPTRDRPSQAHHPHHWHRHRPLCPRRPGTAAGTGTSTGADRSARGHPGAGTGPGEDPVGRPRTPRPVRLPTTGDGNRSPYVATAGVLLALGGLCIAIGARRHTVRPSPAHDPAPTVIRCERPTETVTSRNRLRSRPPPEPQTP